ncbi:hypothetical protein ACJ7VE_25410 [Streptomyces sp. PB17]|uniref:hypothetical protein n=1 Tax=Streptomyces sp. PB17 TaxID=3384158 RepID=UPI0038B4DB5C
MVEQHRRIDYATSRAAWTRSAYSLAGELMNHDAYFAVTRLLVGPRITPENIESAVSAPAEKRFVDRE